MAVREFFDESGRRWRAWSVTPADIHPATKIEEYLDDIYHTGWLVFETVAGDEKRRLSRYQQQWAGASDTELRAMLARAESVQGRRADAERITREDDGPPASLLADDPQSEPSADVTPQQVIRTFRYPGGRYWTVGLVEHPEEGGRPALRFTAGARNIELGSWPKEWADYTDAQLIELLRWAAPRTGAEAPQPGTPRRRWDDRRGLGR
jgi:hypothetical protein